MLCKSLITLITGVVLDFYVNRLKVFLQIALFYCFVITNITRVFGFFHE